MKKNDNLAEKCKSPTFVADCLEEYKNWRKGKGKYAKLGARFPFSMEELTVIETAAIDMLRNLGRQMRDSQ